MKLKTILMFTAVIIFVSFIACSPTKPISIEISYEDFTEGKYFTWVANADVGDKVVVTLGSNPTAGFEWPDMAQIGNKEILQQTGVVGASGKDVWTFKALKKGTTTISMDYSRPWETIEKAEWVFKATITVE